MPIPDGFGEDESAVKVCKPPDPSFTMRENVVVLATLPDTPVTVTVALPVLAEGLAVNVKVVVVVAGFGEKVPVTPFCKPDTEGVTLPLKPF